MNDALYEEAETEFFYWLSKKEDPLLAEVKALAWAKVVKFLARAIPMAVAAWGSSLPWTEEIEDDLVSFFQTRWRNWAKGHEDQYTIAVLYTDLTKEVL